MPTVNSNGSSSTPVAVLYSKPGTASAPSTYTSTVGDALLCTICTDAVVLTTGSTVNVPTIPCCSWLPILHMYEYVPGTFKTSSPIVHGPVQAPSDGVSGPETNSTS